MEAMSTAPQIWTQDSAPAEKRNVWSAMKRGFRGRCPRCGEGKLFRAFLKVDDHCSAFGGGFSPHHAPELPAPLRRVSVRRVVGPTILWIETDYAPPVPLQLAIYLPLTLVLSLLLLQPVKGAVVGVQWALRMHGFDEQNPEP